VLPSDRAVTLGLLESLPQLPVASHEDVMNLVDLQDLAGAGIGWVDAHLLCAARVQGWRILTLDRRLAQVAARLGVAADVCYGYWIPPADSRIRGNPRVKEK
jgi:hypothetical protein